MLENVRFDPEHGEPQLFNEIESLKRHILGWMTLFILMFIPLWWKTTTVYRAPLPFDEMNSSIDFKCKVGIELQYPKEMNAIESLVLERVESAELDFMFGKGADYIFKIECGKVSKVQILISTARSVSITIPVSLCTVENTRDLVSDTILDIFDSKASEDDSMNMIKFSETYQVTWSLLNGDPKNSFFSWDIEQAIGEYFTPLKEAIRPLFLLEFSSQIQNYDELPIKVEKINNSYIIRQDDLPQFINSAELNLVPVASVAPPVNFVVYIPGKSFRPLNILLTKGSLSKLNAFLIPQWGGVLVGQVPDTKLYDFDSKSLGPLMQIFLTQLRTLLGVRPLNTPRLSQRKNVVVEIQKSVDSGITSIELDRLLRDRTIQNIGDASSTLASLARLIKKLPNMIVQDHIQIQVLRSLDYLKKAREYLAENDLKSAAISGRQAMVYAEAAFSDKSMVSLLYFPSEHVLAIYMPFFLPITLPLFAAYKEQWLIWRHLRKSKTE